MIIENFSSLSSIRADTVSTLIEKISELLKLNKLDNEIAIFYFDSKFMVDACNPSKMVLLGEASGKFRCISISLEVALSDVLEQVISYSK